MKYSIKLELPSIEAVTADLSMRGDIGVIGAEDRLKDRTQALTRARVRLSDATRLRESLPARIASGAAAATDLHAALHEEKLAALAIGQFEIEVQRAGEDLNTARIAALDALAVRAARRLEALQRHADQMAPALALLRQLEEAIRGNVTRSERDFDHTMQRTGNDGARQGRRHTRRPGVLPTVEWPIGLADDVSRINGAIAAASQARASASARG